jgi:replication initiation and membrane attachment protein DnaB
MHRHRAFLLTCNRQRIAQTNAAFSISSTHLLNRKNAETRIREESTCVDYGFDLEKFKKHMIRRVKKNRELEPHIVHVPISAIVVQTQI